MIIDHHKDLTKNADFWAKKFWSTKIVVQKIFWSIKNNIQQKNFVQKMLVKKWTKKKLVKK